MENYIQQCLDMDRQEQEGLKSVTCCFTGHRPHKLSFCDDEDNEGCLKIKQLLHNEIENAIQSGYKVFITGGAIGVDTWVALEVIQLRSKYPDIRLEIAIPCENQDKKWNEQSKRMYSHILDEADDISRLSYREYDKGCMKSRNKFMVKRSSRLIAVFNGKEGGTKQTIAMGRKNKLDIHVIEV